MPSNHPIIESFHFRCPYAQRTWIALEEKGIPYSRRVVNLQNKTQMEWYKQNVNPLGKVPAIRDDDGTTLYESEVINETQHDSEKNKWFVWVRVRCTDFWPKLPEDLLAASWSLYICQAHANSKEYLEQKFDCGPNLMPEDAAGCAKVRLWNHHLNNKHLSWLQVLHGFEHLGKLWKPSSMNVLWRAVQYSSLQTCVSNGFGWFISSSEDLNSNTIHITSMLLLLLLKIFYDVFDCLFVFLVRLLVLLHSTSGSCSTCQINWVNYQVWVDYQGQSP